MSEIKRRKTNCKCYGDFGKPAYRSNDCRSCLDQEMCSVETELLHPGSNPEKAKVEKKEIDDAWINMAIDMMIGPHMAILFTRQPKMATELTTIIRDAVRELYNRQDWPDTNAWVVEACERMWGLYNIFMTAKLIDVFDKGVPEPSRIQVVKGGLHDN